METLGTFLDGEWESIFNDFPRQIASQHDSDIANYLPNAFVSPLDYLNGSENEHFDLLFVDDGSLSMNFCAVDVENGGSLSQFFLQDMNNETILANEVSSDSLLMNLAAPCFELPRKRKDASEFRGAAGGKIRSIAASEKKSRVSRATKKGKKKMASEKEHVSYNRKDEEGAIVGLELQSISHEGSDNESNASQEINRQKDSESEEPVVVNSQGKKRASRGAATDPQSFYARKRRMRINERLKILQNLVPNGAKVDISTMLEEAFNYVKFLQLQIKLLSSDELWMFAPLAYDGHNTSLYAGDSPFVSP